MEQHTLFQIILTYTIIVLTGILVFSAISHILYQKRSPTSMISWLLAVLFLPYIAVPLYFIIGIRKRNEKQMKSYVVFSGDLHPNSVDSTQLALLEILSKNGIPPATSGNDYELITSDTKSFELMLELISQSRHSIDISTYVFSYDQTTKEILDALTRKAKEGVKVRMLLDLAGSLGVYINQKCFRELRKAGGEVAFFVPLFKKPLQGYINLRNHRKIYLFDRTKVLSGGMNLSDEYMGAAKSDKRWKDILYKLEGPAVYNFYMVFMNDWNYATGRNEKIETQDMVKKEGENIVQVVPSGPDIPRDALYEALLSTIYDAKERIWIVTPYFVPDDNIMKALLIAHHRGVDIKLITPKESDHIFADLGRSPYMREINTAGMDVQLFEGKMLHAKAILIDNSGGMIGSVNLDNRSLFLNYEIVTFAYSPKLIGQIESWMLDLLAQSKSGMKPVSKHREALENFMKVFAPLL